MSLLSFYFQMHQPRRLKKYLRSNNPFDDRFNRESMEEVSKCCYLPMTALFARLLRENENFRISISVTGTLLDQARMYCPQLLDSLADLGRLSAETGQVEFLAETYYHSLTGLFDDGNKEEFRFQIDKHRKAMKELIGVAPTTFRNTELLYNNTIAAIAGQMGFKTILCEKRDGMVSGQSAYSVFQNNLQTIRVIPRNRDLSLESLGRFTQKNSTAAQYADWISTVEGEAILIGMNYADICTGEWQRRPDVQRFWEELPGALAACSNLALKTPSELAIAIENPGMVLVTDDISTTTSWADDGRNTKTWLGSPGQISLFQRYQEIEPQIKIKGDEQLLSDWRNLGASEHFEQMSPRGVLREGYFDDVSEAVMAYTVALMKLSMRRARKEGLVSPTLVRKKAKRARILLVTPEITELPAGFGNLANVVTAKGGGLADISSALIDEMMKMGLDVHVALPKYERQMLEYSQISHRELDRLASIFKGPKRIHLVQDSAFAHIPSVYATDGSNDALNRAVAFQEKVINQVLSEAMPSHGKMLVHCNDWMTGLIPAAAKERGFKTMFTVHNVFSQKKTLRQMEQLGIDVSRFSHDLYLSEHPDSVSSYWDHVGVDFLLSGVKAADFVNTVSPTFLHEIVNGFFPDIISWQAREEFRAKYYSGCASGILNAPMSSEHPKIAKGLAVNYDETSFVEGKQQNKLEFQKQMGLRIKPTAPIMFWPSRLYAQKGPELLAAIAQMLVDTYREDGLQIAVVANGDFGWESIYGQIACASGGRIAYANFDPHLSELGKAASDFILMPSLYEPCGLPQMEGMRFGTLPIVRATGGLKDSVQHLDFEQGKGNGFVFNDYVSDAFWWACEEAMRFYRTPEKVRYDNIRRVMREGVHRFNLERTVLEYIRIYERLLGEKLL